MTPSEAKNRGMMGGFDEDEHAVFGTNQGSGAEAEKADGVVKDSVPNGPGRPGRGKAWPGLWEFSGAWTGPSL